MITAILGFPVAVHRNPNNHHPTRKVKKSKSSDDESSGFDEADDEEIPSEDGNYHQSDHGKELL